MNATNPDGGGGETSSFWPPQLPSLHTLFLVFFSTIAIIIARIWLVSEDPVEKRLRMKEEKKRRRKEEGRRKDGVKVVVCNPNRIHWLHFVIELIANHYHKYIHFVPICAIASTTTPSTFLSFTVRNLSPNYSSLTTIILVSPVPPLFLLSCCHQA